MTGNPAADSGNLSLHALPFFDAFLNVFIRRDVVVGGMVVGKGIRPAEMREEACAYEFRRSLGGWQIPRRPTREMPFLDELTVRVVEVRDVPGQDFIWRYLPHRYRRPKKGSRTYPEQWPLWQVGPHFPERLQFTSVLWINRQATHVSEHLVSCLIKPGFAAGETGLNLFSGNVVKLAHECSRNSSGTLEVVSVCISDLIFNWESHPDANRAGSPFLGNLEKRLVLRRGRA